MSSSPNAGPLGYKASVSSLSVVKESKTYPVRNGSGASLGNATWRVVRGTGNCCENYLGATSTGWLVDMGGTYLNFSTDTGVVWKQVRPIEPLVSGEGAVVSAPNGDILAMTWDPYSGDHVVTFKYEAAENIWYSNEISLRTPFFDRPWLAVVPGPITVAGTSYPYVSILKGGFPSKGIFYYSLDGLNYLIPSSKEAGRINTMSKWLTVTADTAADWYQPHREAHVTPLGSGEALAGLDFGESGCRWRIQNSNLEWACYVSPSGSQLPGGDYLRDSQGRLHHLAISNSLTYRVSADGGLTWSSTVAALPASHEVEDWDFKVNGALEVAAVAIHSHNFATGDDQDLVYKFAIGTRPSLERLYFLGLGDQDFSSGLGANLRFDFDNVVILPDGTIATSFVDSQHLNPSLAILTASP